MKHLLAGSRDSLSAKASKIRLSSKKLSDIMKSGSFRSLYRGKGMEFAGVREYIPGDDVRSIDWNVTARMTKPFVKIFEEENELEVFLIVDRSASMFVGTNGKVKYETAAEVAAVLTLAAEQNESPVGAVLFDGKIHFASRPERGRNQSMTLLTKLDEVSGIENGSALKSAISGAVKLLKHHSLVFVISDFRSAGWEEQFKKLCRHNDVVAVRVTDPADWNLPEVGSFSFTDAENGNRSVFPTANRDFKSAWREEFRNRTKKMEEFCIRYKADFVSISTQEDVPRMLLNLFLAKEGNRRGM